MKTTTDLETTLRGIAKSCTAYAFDARETDHPALRDLRRHADEFKTRIESTLTRIDKERQHEALKARLAAAISDEEARAGFPMSRALDASGLHGDRREQGAVTQALLDLGFDRAYVGRGHNQSLGFKRGA